MKSQDEVVVMEETWSSWIGLVPAPNTCAMEIWTVEHCATSP